MPSTPNSPIHRLQDLLRELFQFDCADLDFGIYRIMNHKREVIERFIATKLPEAIDAELGTEALERQARLQEALEEERKLVIKILGPETLDPEGNFVDESLARTKLGGDYLDAKARAAASRSREAVEADVYNHLYTFFSRYYQEGDFISKRRYSRSQRYMIPYNGEEVLLHWANSDQYYIKTEEHFRNYHWKAPGGVTVRFHVQHADVEQNNVKGERRVFLPMVEDASWDETARTVAVPFQYRPLGAEEKRAFGNSPQDKIIAAAVAALPQRFEHPDALAALTGERRRTEGGEPVTHLEHHLRQYTRRNDSDFFIHKDLRGFLARELDYYLKSELLNLGDLATAGEFAAEGWFQLMRLITAIGGQIIDFLAQIEGFQKMLWEKRRFVVATDYCVAVGVIPAGFYGEIAANEAQWAEWRGLSLIDDDAEGLFDACDTAQERQAFLGLNPTLMVDTAHFDKEFSDRLLAAIDDIGGKTDGTLIQSDNWQALNFLSGPADGDIDCIYIDPPYNTDASAILYKNGYKDSSWLALMANVLAKSKELLKQEGVLCCAIDDEEAWRLRALMQDIFEHELGIVPVRSNPAGRKSRGQFSPAHEYAFFFGRERSTPGPIQKNGKELARYPLEDANGRYAWNNLIRHGSNDRRADRPKMYFPIYVNGQDALRVPPMKWDDNAAEYQVLEQPEDGEVAVWPTRMEDGELVEKNWHRGPERVVETLNEYRVRRVEGSPGVEIDFRIYLDTESMPKTWWDDARYASANHGAKSLKDLFSEKNFDFPKAPGLVEDCLRASRCRMGATVLDYFSGSGTTGNAVVNLNRHDGGERKFILVEMGNHFDSVVLPRMKKVTFSPEWKDGRPVRGPTPEEAERSPRIIKVVRLESYEDALDSIEFDEDAAQLKLEDRIEGHFLHYLLKWETKHSATLLSPAMLTAPFSYQLRVHRNGNGQDLAVDVPETFNYLLGLSVRTRRIHQDEDRRYLVYRGETRDAPGRLVVVIWRETTGWAEEDFSRDRRFVAEQRILDGADVAYINGGSCITGAEPLEPLFKERMFADVSDR